MSLPIRNSVKVLLLNDKDELLLIQVDDPKTTSLDGVSRGLFWCLVGGGIKPGETVQEAALREIYEGTGIQKEDIELGPVVWYGIFDFVRVGIPTRMKEQFIVAKTKKQDVKPVRLSSWEKAVITQMKWFLLEQIQKSSEIIYPVVLPHYLPDILAGKYPEQPIEIDLAKQPEKTKGNHG